MALSRLDPVELEASLSGKNVPPDVVSGALRRASEQLARATSLRAVVRAMLVAPTVEDALQMVVDAVTDTKSGIGFERAVLFQIERARGAFVGVTASGPASDMESKLMRSPVGGAGREVPRPAGPPGAALRAKVRTLELALDGDADEVRAALDGAPSLVRLDGPARAPGLARLVPAPRFVLVPLKLRSQPLGLLFADNRFSRAPVDPGRVRELEDFLEHAALAWHDLRHARDLEALTRVDALTGLATRREFETRLAVERSRVRRTREPVTVLMLEIDDLAKTIEEVGRPVAEALLRRVGTLLREELRAHDLAARFVGDAFGLILPGAGAFEAAAVSRRLGVLLHRCGISVSIGAAAFPDDADDVDDLVTIADKHVFLARSDGGGRSCLSEDGAPLVFALEDEAVG